MLRSSPLFVILAIVAASTINFADPDLWRHLLVGRMVLQTGHLPLRDTFSYTAFGQPWRQHEWLAQSLMALFYEGLGAFGLKLLKLACAAAAISLLAAGMARTGAAARVQRPVLIFVALALAPLMQFRPQLFTYVILSWLLALLAAETYRGSSKLWMAIPAFALWANLHGGFVVGLAAMGIYTGVVAVQDLWRRQGLSHSARLAAITAGCGLATLINPLGIGVWSNVMHSLTDPLVKSAGTEWQPLLSVLGEHVRTRSPGVIIYSIPIALFAALAVCFVMAPAMDDAALLAVAAMFGWGGFYAVRNIGLAAIAVAIPLARHAGMVARGRDRSRGRVQGRADADPGFNPVLAASLSVLLAWFGGLFSNHLRLGFDYPVSAVAFMKEHRLCGNILCHYSWGEYLMWHVGPVSKVFIDGRLEQIYPRNVMEEYIRFEQGKPGAGDVLDGNPNDFVLVPPASASYRVVIGDGQWKIVYRDPAAVLFAHASSPLARNMNHPAVGPVSAGYFP